MTSAIEEVTQLVLRERQTRDRGWWAEMASCYAEHSLVDISWFTGSGADFVRQTIEASKDGVWGRHRLSPPAVRVRDDRAWAELPIAIEFRIDVEGVEADLISYARSQYRCRRMDGAWRIVHFTSIYERDTLTPSKPRPSAERPSGGVRAFPFRLSMPSLVSGSGRKIGWARSTRR